MQKFHKKIETSDSKQDKTIDRFMRETRNLRSFIMKLEDAGIMSNIASLAAEAKDMELEYRGNNINQEVFEQKF